MRRKKGVFWGFPGFGDLGGGRGGVSGGGAKIREIAEKGGNLPKKG